MVGEDVLDAVARRSLDTTLHGPAEAAVIVGWGSPASHSDLVVAQAANYLLSQPDWAPVPAPAVAPPQAERRDFWSAVKQTAGFNAKTFAAVISWLLSSGRAGFEKRATGVLVGDGAGVLVTLGPRVVDSPEEIAKNVLRDERDQIDQRIRLEATRAMAPQPTVWTHLRALAFGLVDGGPVDGITERSADGWRATGTPWHYDQEHYDGVLAVRRREADIMRRYIRGEQCLMQLLQQSLDDPDAAPCGRCSVCLGRLPDPLGAQPAPDTVAQVRQVLRTEQHLLEPRKMWPGGAFGRRGRIPAAEAADEGRPARGKN